MNLERPTGLPVTFRVHRLTNVPQSQWVTDSDLGNVTRRPGLRPHLEPCQNPISALEPCQNPIYYRVTGTRYQYIPVSGPRHPILGVIKQASISDTIFDFDIGSQNFDIEASRYKKIIDIEGCLRSWYRYIPISKNHRHRRFCLRYRNIPKLKIH